MEKDGAALAGGDGFVSGREGGLHLVEDGAGGCDGVGRGDNGAADDENTSFT
jgi:hypothetical protein